MSLDETLFRWAWKLASRLTRPKVDPAVASQTATLSALRHQLTLIARVLSGEPVDIREAEAAGGYAADILYLPRSMHSTAEPAWNVRAYVYRVAYTVTSRQLGYTVPAAQAAVPAYVALATLLAVAPTLKSLEAELPRSRELRAYLFPRLLQQRPPVQALDTLTALYEALTQLLLGAEWAAFELSVASPGLPWLQQCWQAIEQGQGPLATARLLATLPAGYRRRRSQVPPPVALWGQLMPAPVRAAQGGQEQTSLTASATDTPQTERRGKPKEQLRRVSLDQQDIDNDVLVHTFEKVETAEEFAGVTRTPDGADELAQHADALDELDLRDVVRSDVPTRSLYRSDVVMDGVLAEAEDEVAPATALLYDEWDAAARQYKRAWCRIYLTRPAPSSPRGAVYTAQTLQRYATQVRDLRHALDRIRYRRVLRNRQPDGTDIDLDALVERYATVRSGHAPDDRLYLARRRHERDLATLILVDMSYSTDAWVQGHRVLDVAKAAVLVLGEVLAGYRDRVALGSFYSHTRRDCRFVLLKDFATPWTQCTASLADLEPTGYTRIGPALRHGMHLLRQQPAARKLLLLISDGKPTDYDRYEGRYGLADVRQAMREAAQARLHTYALAVDAQARLYLPQMFGTGNYQLLPHPTHLVRSLTQLYSRLSS